MENLTRESIIKAILLIDGHPGLRKGRESFQYDLKYNGKSYPPILVLSEANKLLGGSEITIRDFNNSTEKAFKSLTDLGFHVVEKQKSFYGELLKFLEQSKTSDLKYSHYLKSFLGLNVRVSFGKGNVARIPWISFMGKGQTNQSGIYPVYLFYKELKKLVLAYGVSETNEPDLHWNLPLKIPTIKDYFEKNNIGIPERYGSSFIFKVYDISNLPPSNELDEDLREIITKYKIDLNISKVNYTPKPQRNQAPFNIAKLIESIRNAGLLINVNLLKRFTASQLTKPFVILTGLSGSGKTKLAQAFAQWICEDKSQYCIVPVGADWTNREPLLGYPNALKGNEFIKPDNGTLDLLIAANENPDHPYFLILDEMNLSHVERYFADFLSVMESNETIVLYSGELRKASDKTEIPESISLPSNLFIIGTVNIDETTYMFSPKVLDRANVIEFRVSTDEISNFLTNPQFVNLKQLEGEGVEMAQSFLQLASNKNFENDELPEVNTTLLVFFNELKKLGAEFGYRSANEIVRLINQLGVISPDMDTDNKIDIAIMQKLLPKLHGSRRKLVPVLLKLGEFCIHEKTAGKIESDIFMKEEFELDQVNVRYPISLEKLIRMYKGAIENGFASYAEA